MSSLNRRGRRVKRDGLSLRGQLLLCNFVAGFPPHLTPEAVDIDRAMVESRWCPAGCEWHQRFHPFHRPEDGAYRVIGVCPACHCEEEY